MIDKPNHIHTNWIKYIAGDNSALSVVYKELHSPLYFTAYHYLQDENEANDIVNDVFLKLLEMSTNDRSVILSEVYEKLNIYLKVMVKNKCLDKIKTDRNRKSIRDSIKVLFNRYEYSNGTAEFDYLELIAALPDQQKQIFEMHKDGFDNQSIAEELNISYNTVRNTLSTSKKKLRVLWHKLM